MSWASVGAWVEARVEPVAALAGGTPHGTNFHTHTQAKLLDMNAHDMALWEYAQVLVEQRVNQVNQ